MSAPSPSWRAEVARWVARGATAVAAAALDAVVESLELGKRALAWVGHAPAARLALAAALALAVAGGAAWAARRAPARSLGSGGGPPTSAKESVIPCNCSPLKGKP